MNHEDEARRLFLAGYNCAQAVFCAFCDVTGLDRRVDEFVSDVRSVEWDSSQIRYGEFDDRFDKGNYTPESLKEVLEAIAKDKGCSPEEVSEEDFAAYVGPKTFNDTVSLSFDRESGRDVYEHSTKVI